MVCLQYIHMCKDKGLGKSTENTTRLDAASRKDLMKQRIASIDAHGLQVIQYANLYNSEHLEMDRANRV